MVDRSTLVTYTIEQNNGTYPKLDKWVLIADIGDERIVFDDNYSTKNQALADVRRLANNWYKDSRLGWCLWPYKQN